MLDATTAGTLARQNAVVAHSHDVVMFFQEDGTIEWVSLAAQEQFGVPASELIGRNGLEMVHPDDQERVFADFASITELGDHVRTEFRILDASGRVRWVDEIVTNLLDDPDVGLLVASLRDVTDRVEAEQAGRFQARLLGAVGQAVVARDNDDLITYWNRAAEVMYGWSAEETLGRPLSSFLGPGSGWEAHTVALNPVLQDGASWSGEFRLVRRDGTPIPIFATNTPVLDDDGLSVGMISVSSDITERTELLERIETDRHRLADAQASARLGSFEIDRQTGQVFRSAELCRILGVEASDPAAMTVEPVHQDDRAMVRRAHHQAVAEHSEVELKHRIVRPDGEVRWVRSRVDAREGGRIAGTTFDITESHEAELVLTHQATHDLLTGLPNRVNFVEQLRTALAHAGRRNHIALAFVDMDRFKQINDAVGHETGDAVLKAASDQLVRGLRPGDIIARIGGDEFVLMRCDLQTLDQAAAFAEEARSVLGAPVEVDGRSFQMSASIGVALSTTSDTPASLMRDADDAMYQAKQDGRDRITAFDQRARQRAHRRQSLAQALAGGLEAKQFHLEYQPVFELPGRQVVGFEALLRWVHPDFGSISPGEFIPIAEASGMIFALGDWVLAEAIGQLAAWQSAPDVDDRLWMAINLSADQLRQPQLVERVGALIEHSGVTAGTVHLEITESSLMDRVDNAIQTLGALRALGARVSIDDFGTGYSSLSYLSRLPVDIIKIDRSFVEGLGEGRPDTPIVRAIMALAATLDLHVVAEGIERPEQAELLTELGCEFGQGFLWSPSLIPDEARRWIDGSRSAG